MMMTLKDGTDVMISEMKTPGVYLMEWGSDPASLNVMRAFDELIDAVKNSSVPVNVIVDIRADPAFPIHVTTTRAMRVTRQKQFHQWLVVGSNRSAKIISNVLNSVGQAKITWYDSIEDAYQASQSAS